MYKILGEEIGSELKARNTPGVFIQGLVVYSGADDEVLFERLLSEDVLAQVEGFCEEQGVSLIAYSGDRIVSIAVTATVLRCEQCDGQERGSIFFRSIARCARSYGSRVVLILEEETLRVRPWARALPELFRFAARCRHEVVTFCTKWTDIPGIVVAHRASKG